MENLDATTFLALIVWSTVHLIRKHLWTSLDGVSVLGLAAILSLLLGKLLGMSWEQSIASFLLASGVQTGLKSLIPKDGEPLFPKEAPPKLEEQIKSMEEQIQETEQKVEDLQSRLEDVARRKRL